MDFSINLPTFLSSGVVAGLVAALVALRTSERNIVIENITKQRQVWREKVRDLALRINDTYQRNEKSTLQGYYIELQLILNPNDKNDLSILDTLWEMINEERSSNLNIVLSEKLALLLKHDWERAKLEAKPFWFKLCKPTRYSYGEFKHKRNKS
ncbi:MAG: hypothetical protein OEY89_18895 [Gammaproteobacteria bacterium]|nr:hypothetical protein [Gammaproteobacteria bacterium]